MARHGIKGTHLFTVDGTDETFGDVEHVFVRGHLRGSADRHGLIGKVEGGYIALAEPITDDHHTIGPEFSGGHRTRRAAAESAVAMTERAPAVRAEILARIAATA